MLRISVFVIGILFSITSYGQNNLLDQLDNFTAIPEKTPIVSTFKSYKVVNFETPKLVPKHHLNFIVAHRFGTIKNGIEDLFGLDVASTRLQFVYGLTDKINLSFSRSKFMRTYDGGIKYQIAQQQKEGFPFTIAGHHSIAINTLFTKELYPSLEFANRLRSAHQLIIASKLSENLSVELVPTILHDGTVQENGQDNWQYALGLGARYLLTKRVGIIADYGYHLNRIENSVFNNVFSLGMEIETGGHVFQLHFSNAQAMFENAFITEAIGDWSQRDIYFGFNINRIFNLKTKK